MNCYWIFGELWFAEEEDILGKLQEFFKERVDGVFYSCDYAGQSENYNTHTIKDSFLSVSVKIKMIILFE